MEAVGEMEKYYCDKCRLLYDEKLHCRVCGSLAGKKIYIEVQKQPEK
jgi:rubredoxin